MILKCINLLQNMKVKHVKQLCFEHLQKLSDQQIMEAIETPALPLADPIDPTSRLQGEVGGGGGGGGGGGEGEEFSGPDTLSLEQNDRMLEAMETVDSGGDGDGDGGDGGDSKDKIESRVLDDETVISVSDVSESSHGGSGCDSGHGLGGDVNMDEKFTPTSADLSAPSTSANADHKRRQTRQDNTSGHTAEQAAADEAESSLDGRVNIESSQLLEMELRRRALEAELLRANAEHKRPEGRVSEASASRHGQGVESENCVESEDMIYLYPEGDGEEEAWLGKQSGRGKVEAGPVDVRDKVEVELMDGRGMVEPMDGRDKVEPVDGRGKVEPMDGRGKVEPMDGRGKVEPMDGRGKVESMAGHGKLRARPMDRRGKLELGRADGRSKVEAGPVDGRGKLELGRADGRSKMEAGPVDGRDQLEVESEMGESLEESLRQRALQSMLARRSTTRTPRS